MASLTLKLRVNKTFAGTVATREYPVRSTCLQTTIKTEALYIFDDSYGTGDLTHNFSGRVSQTAAIL